jgi:hypothetical protein
VLVVRDVDGGGLQPLVEMLELNAGLVPEFRIEIAKRLVEEKQVRLAHEAPPDGDTLALSA